MFNKITFIGYGREVKNSDWYIAPICGVTRFYFIHSGEVIFCGGGNKHILQSGKIYIFPQNLPFELICDESTSVDHTFYDFFSLPAIIMNDVLEIDPGKHPVIYAAAKVLIEFAVKDKKLYEELTENYMKAFLSAIKKEIVIFPPANSVITDAVEYIHNNFSTNISISEMAKKYHLEKSVFIRKFKKHTGLTPYQYLKNHRINYAVALIKSNSYSLGEIAEMTAYCDQSSLSHAIKSATDLYPEEIQKKYAK